MAYERSWAFGNVFDSYTGSSFLDQAKRRLWSLKQFIVGTVGGSTSGAWTVRYSCDGVTAGTADDGVDRWGATYTPANIVRGGAGAARSWIVLRSPTLDTGVANAGNPMTVDMLISFGNSTADTSAVFAFSKTGFTGGSTTTNPSAADEWGWLNSSTTAATFSSTSTLALRKLHGIRSSTGDWLVVGQFISTGSSDFVGYCIAPVDCKVNDQYPVMTAAGFATSNNAAATASILGLAGNASNQGLRNHVGGASSRAGLTVPIVVSAGPDAADSNKIIDLPAWCLVQTSTVLATRGRLPDIGVMPMIDSGSGTQIATGSVIRDAQNNIVYCTFGGLIVPFNVAPDVT